MDIKGISPEVLIWDEAFQVDQDAPKPVKKKRSRPRPRRCRVCKTPIESDGYGDYIHSVTGLYCEKNEKGEVTHVAAR